jgi:hypothetical protein
LSRSLAIEGAVIRSTSHRISSGYLDNRLDRPYSPFSTTTTDHEALNAAVNLLYRKGGAHLSAFAGGGPSVHRSETNMRFDTRCEPRVAGGCDGRPDTTTRRRSAGSEPTWQLSGGVDARIASRLTAFAGARWLTTSLSAGDTGLGAMSGIRLAFRPMPETANRRRTGPRVRVTSRHGDRNEGGLVSLSASEVVVVHDERTLTIPLAQVSRVERVTHHVRNGILWGAAGGFAGGYLGSCGSGDEDDCWPEIGALVAGVGAGVGALVGMIRNRSGAADRVMYPSPTPSVRVAPRIARSRAGLDMTFRF